MTLWHPDTCDCEVTNDRGAWEFTRRCKRHTSYEDMITENRAAETAREIVQKELNLSEAPEWIRAEDGNHEVLIPDDVSAKKRAAIEVKLADTGIVTKTVSEFLAAEMTAAFDG